jgi:hypothetical protein
MIWVLTRGTSGASGNQDALKVFYTADSALLLGAGGGVSPMGQSPADTVTAPAIGDQTIKDADNLPYFPSLFLTDISTNPKAISGDAQDRGQANKPDFLSGAWKALGQPDPQPNGQTRGTNADPWPVSNGPGGPRGTAFTTEAIWKTATLKALDPLTNQQILLKKGNTYRVQVILHNGENAGKVGVVCFKFTLP